MERRWKFGSKSFKFVVCVLVGVCAVTCAVSALAQAPQPPSNIPPPPKWPTEFQKDGNVLIVYQPQIRDWNRFRELTSDTAISITPKGGKPVLGVVSWHATTVTDAQARIVVIKDIQLTQARFPSPRRGCR